MNTSPPQPALARVPSAVLELCQDRPEPSTLRRSASGNIGPSSRAMQALDPAITMQPLRVPPMPASFHAQARQVQSFADLVVPVTRRGDALFGPHDTCWQLGRVFGRGTYGAIRRIDKLDPAVPQRYVAKELARPNAAPDAPQVPHPPELWARWSAQPSHTAELVANNAEGVEREVDLMLRARSQIAPRWVLRTPERDFLVLLPLNGSALDMFRAAVRSARDDETTLPKEHAHRLPHFIFACLVDELGRMHQQGLAHRDVKLDNCLFSAQLNALFLGDFGLAIDMQETTEVFGAVNLLPPEAFHPPSDHQAPYDAQKADIFAAGVAVARTMIGEYMLSPLSDDQAILAASRRGGRVYLERVVPVFEGYYAAWAQAAPLSEKDRRPNLRRNKTSSAHRPRDRRPLPKLSPTAQPYFTENLRRFELLKQVDADLYAPLHAALCPLPKNRPTAQKLKQAIERAKGPTLPDMRYLWKPSHAPALTASPESLPDSTLHRPLSELSLSGRTQSSDSSSEHTLRRQRHSLSRLSSLLPVRSHSQSPSPHEPHSDHSDDSEDGLLVFARGNGTRSH